MTDGVSLQTKRGLMELERAQGEPMLQPAMQPQMVPGLSNRPLNAPAMQPQRPASAKDTFQQLFTHFKSLGDDDATARSKALSIMRSMKPTNPQMMPR